jgi:hypothetical protein
MPFYFWTGSKTTISNLFARIFVVTLWEEVELYTGLNSASFWGFTLLGDVRVNTVCKLSLSWIKFLKNFIEVIFYYCIPTPFRGGNTIKTVGSRRFDIWEFLYHSTYLFLCEWCYKIIRWEKVDKKNQLCTPSWLLNYCCQKNTTTSLWSAVTVSSHRYYELELVFLLILHIQLPLLEEIFCFHRQSWPNPSYTSCLCKVSESAILSCNLIIVLKFISSCRKSVWVPQDNQRKSPWLYLFSPNFKVMPQNMNFAWLSGALFLSLGFYDPLTSWKHYWTG